ncbi:SCO family protein [Aquihabitans sp. G128]|uniref:SCO family protein n=1 Tax=Aquihabitans sp. G128 TaxID=2849779 RepID=UPI001C222FC0|nr:SCO family protein [Aquihabitans sp. G128]QXC60623.1 SCO family protein [Aquihabitans sp. G128]
MNEAAESARARDPDSRRPPRGWKRREILRLGAAVVTVGLVGCTGDSIEAVDRESDPSWAGSLLDPPFDKPDVNLIDFNGAPFPFRRATEGRLTVLFFGYTNCPDVCPIFLNTMAAAKRTLGRRPGSDALVLFVGVDRDRDTPEALRSYLAGIDDSFVGLTGEADQIDQAISDLKMAPVVFAQPGTPVGGEVGHQARVFVFSPDNVSHRLYNHDVSQNQWRKDLPRLAQGQW